jgi:hypothetical protein
LPCRSAGRPDRRKVDDHARFGRRDVRRNSRGETVGIDQCARQIDAARRPDVLHILVQAGGIGAGGDRLEAGGAQSVAPARWSRAQVMKVLPISVSVPVRK